ncbi:MAG: ABC transporter ATP-binding protein [Clostridium sp.]
MNSYQNKISIKNLHKSFEDMEILKDITLQVNEGEVVSIIGPSGCGKSTIFNLITGLTKENEGSLNINGEVSYMYQKDMMVPWKKVIDNISLPLIFKGKSKKEAREEALKYTEMFGLNGFEHKYPMKLSGGMKQRANFLKTYLTSNDIMLLDEPFGALDSLTRKNLQGWLLNIKDSMNSSILLITHDIDEAIILSDRIYVLSEKPARIKGEVIVKFTFPRDENIVLAEEFTKVKKQILNLISK